MLNKLKQNIIGSTYYSDEYWSIIQDFVYNEKNDFGDFIISYLLNTEKENLINDDSVFIISILQSLYPFKDSQIDSLAKSMARTIFKLNQIDQIDLILIRDRLLYNLMDVIFHNPEVICDVSVDSRKKILESIEEMIELRYDVSISDSDSYFKNYTVIQFVNYFKNENEKNRLVVKYLSHFDSRIREDMEFENKEHKEWIEKNKNS